MLWFHHSVKPEHQISCICDSFPTMVLTNRFKRLGSRPLSRSSRHPCLHLQVCASSSHLSSTVFYDIIYAEYTNIRSMGGKRRWTGPFCTATATRFTPAWKHCSTLRSRTVRALSAATRRAATASSSPKMSRPRHSASRPPKPSGRPSGNARSCGWLRRTARNMSNIHANATSFTCNTPILSIRSALTSRSSMSPARCTCSVPASTSRTSCAAECVRRSG